MIVFIICELSLATICDFCKKDFKVPGRHVWRCKLRAPPVIIDAVIDANPLQQIERIILTPERSINTPDKSIANNEFEIDPTNDPPIDRDSEDREEEDEKKYIKCYCGKKCLGLRGLQAHKRACRIINIPDIKALLELPLEGDDDEEEVINEIENILFNKEAVLNGIKLPSNNSQWERANNYFRDNIAYQYPIVDTNSSILELQSLLYNYFKSNYGVVNQNLLEKFKLKYSSYSNRKLKRRLKELKVTEPNNEDEIRFLSKYLRSKFNNNVHLDLPSSFDHETQIKNNIWKYCEKTLNQERRVTPEFNEATCYKNFQNKLKRKRSNKNFDFPGWMERLPDPTTIFDKSPPTYQEITKIIMKMRSSASPCPYDQLSIIVLKKCPILRTYMTSILSKVWSSSQVPVAWKHGITVLAYKKGDAKDPDNFRPITLEPVLLKILTAFVRNRIYTYLCINGYIDQKVQKGFWSKISGTIEHTETLTYLMNHARNKQRSLIVTLIDLRNAFGEVNHSMLTQVMNYHNLPGSLSNLVLDLYNGFKISVAAKDFVTNPILVERGVLQGDSLSPLLFNLCFNTLMVTIKKEQLRCLGYCYDIYSNPRQWLQFADDTALVTSIESDNQLLLNLFTKWTIWADLPIRIDKCHTFGVKKSATESYQFEPYLVINKERIPPVKSGESFVYLGKAFNFSMNSDEVKQQLVSDLGSYLDNIDRLPVHPKFKIRILMLYVNSKIRWPFSIYDLGITWIKQNCDSIVTNYIRRWLKFHPGANLKHLTLSCRSLGINLKLPSNLFDSCQTSTRRLLRSSKDPNIKRLYTLSKNQKNVRQDEIVEAAGEGINYVVKKNCNKILKQKTEEATWEEFLNLKKENIIIKFITESLPVQRIRSWQYVVDRMPSNIYSFCRRALILALPTKANLKTWNIAKSNLCSLCKIKPETQHHIMNNCSRAVEEGRYTWRHDSLLHTMGYHLQKLLNKGYELFVDIPEYNTPGNLFNSKRPDIAFKFGNDVYVVELTVCFETNFEKSRRYKESRYEHLKHDLKNTNHNLQTFYIEFSALGFCTPSIIELNRLLRRLDVDVKRMVEICSELCIRTSYYIFNRRDKVWTRPELMKYH